MKIIIVGCGKVGLTLAERLGSEQHDLVLIDSSLKKIQEIPDDLDAIKLWGNGASISTLLEGGIKDTELLIAVTESDELNLLCCVIAKKAGDCNTIARVRNPIYNNEIDFIKERLGISMIINPELTAAVEISRLLRFPSAINIDTFSKGRVELLRFRLSSEFALDGISISSLLEKVKCDILVCAVERGETISIPDGDFILQDNDYITILGSPRNASEFFRKIGFETHQVHNAMIVGGGTIAYYLAKILIAMKIKVRIVEQNVERCEQLSELLPSATIINGDGTNRDLLMEEGLPCTESFITLTNLDEENILLSLFAKEHTKGKLITKVTKISFDHIIEKLDIGSVIYPKYIMADYIVSYARAMQNTIGCNVETLYHILDNQAEALEFSIREESPVVNVPLMEMHLKKNLLIGGITRHGKFSIPRGHDTIQIGDTVIVVTTRKGLHDIRDILEK